ncbi:hypothetical protein [uncultured Shewanella sp.]|uniref:hypothetical protein n=1 Tax=uncultured Shewanella sp. TaxID=173975 RepID=UPI0026175E63|nr:hypothetical protein [uncultured Shewanella sp.]
MSDEISFRIQLGLILPKLQESLKDDLLKISQELMTIIKSGSLDDQKVESEEIKNILMQDLEILVDRDIIPPIDAMLNPPSEDTEAGNNEDGTEEAASEE